MADVRKLFKGIQQVTQAYFDKVADKTGYLWFVKRADEADPYGDIYFGGDHYGHYSEKEQDQIAKISQIESDLAQAKKDIEAAQGNATAQDAAIKKQEMAVKKLEDLLGAVGGYEYKEVNESVVPDEVKNNAGVNAKPEANAGSAEFVKVVTGEPATTTYYQKEVSSLKTVIDAIKTSIEEVKAEVAKIKVKDVAAKDKVLALSSEGVLSSTLSLEYNKEQKKIYLYGKDQTETNLIGFVDTTDFVKDGMLDTAEVVVVRKSGDKFVYGDGEGTEAVGVTAAGKYIRMHFNTDGAKQDIFLSVGEMVAAYTGGKDIKISAENAIDVSLSEDITIAGGPLADDLNDWQWTDAGGNKIIPAGKSLTEILTALFLKEVNGTLTESYSWSPSVGAPSAKFDKTGAIEVGTNITPTFAANDTVSGNNSKVSISGTYGVVVDDKFQSGAYTETKAGTVTGTAAASATIKLGSDAAVAATSGTVYSAKEGANTLSVSNAGLTANAAAFTAKTVYASTNTKKKVDSVSKVVDVDRFISKALASNASASLTAYYPIYAYGATSSTGDTSAPTVVAPAEPAKLPLVADGKQFGVAFPAMVDGGAGYRILLEAGKSIKSATALNGLTSKYDINCLDKFKKGESVDKATGATTTAYNVWEYKGTEGANRVIFTIGK